MKNRVREARENIGITQLELAKRSGISRATLSVLENEPTKATTGKTMFAIAKAMQMEVSSLFFN